MKPLHYFTLLIAASLVVTSCAKTKKYVFDVPEMDPLQPDSGEGYHKVSEFPYTLKDVHSSVGIDNLNTKGDTKILVVPVMALDGPSWTSRMINNVKKGFFGEPEDTGWHSVKSFYHYSSYGNINIDGEVASVLRSNYTVSELSRMGTSESSVNPDSIILQEFEKSSSYSSLRKKYDTDHNGYIDSVVFVYSNQIDSEKGYWAWVYWGDSNPSESLPTVNSYMWVSYDFFVQNKKSSYIYAAYGGEVDAHTIVHETGHLMGLDDYYCYDKDGWDPSGKIEMHSYNIGDDNIYSKLSLGWVNPYYVKTLDSVTLSLRTSAGYGDAIILADSWNGSTQDEYIIIEYYSPHGMNRKDADNAYPGNGYQMYTTSGFRIYHVDARIVELGPRGKMIDYVDSMSKGKFYAVGASNSKSYSYLEEHKDDYKLIHLMEAGGVNTFKQGKYATNDTLFTKGKTFEASKQFFYNVSKLNNGSDFGYRISVDECEEFKGTITISKI